MTDVAPRVLLELAGAQGELTAMLRDHPPAPGARVPIGAFEAFVGDPRLTALRVYHVLTPNDVAQSVPWELEGRAGTKEHLDITMTPHVSGATPGGVRIEVDVRGHAHTTVVVRDQESVVFSGFSVPLAESTEALFVLTPYVVWSDADSRRLLECMRAVRGRN